MIKVLFLCKGNSCRSIIAEAVLNRLGGDRFVAFSAGSEPNGEVDPLTVQTLQELGYNTMSLRSKSWEQFESVPLDVVITVCKTARDDVCPVWRGQAPRVNWDVSDPSKAKGSKQKRLDEFYKIYSVIEGRIKKMMELPIEDLRDDEIVEKLSLIAEELAV